MRAGLSWTGACRLRDQDNRPNLVLTGCVMVQGRCRPPPTASSTRRISCSGRAGSRPPPLPISPPPSASRAGTSITISRPERSSGRGHHPPHGSDARHAEGLAKGREQPARPDPCLHPRRDRQSRRDHGLRLPGRQALRRTGQARACRAGSGRRTGVRRRCFQGQAAAPGLRRRARSVSSPAATVILASVGSPFSTSSVS